ncbi:VIT-domain-containing protein [Lojkania enalia]|uniref:VIT-domain-containing protein n=1 Tax=Lojkania enalia TaxID=147567 RepID=A0A9P4K0V5_9PLEO|nr:VIT-domain-containing protein [Didymosphaeria enalia]
MSIHLVQGTGGWRAHSCGLYYTIAHAGQLQKQYLPQVSLQAHSTILSTSSRTTLTQTFVNPSDKKGIKEVRYVFPLYDGVSVVGFTCHVGNRTIVGEVKEKEKAKAVFQEAVAKGETAGLLEQLPNASDVFTTTVGNIPPGARVIIQITYLGELKHDMEIDGIRFIIPNIICPRYGNLPHSLFQNPAPTAQGNGISITVDAEMAEGSYIQKIQSPSHPISMSMGTTSFAPNAEPKMTKASATLTLGTAELDTDFILQIIAKDVGVPKAILETHPTIPNQRALMATLVPKFALPQEKPEVVFVCDRSGSMSGSRITLVKQALKVFLKSLPVGIKFNICSFGSRFSFLWPNSKTYSQETLNEAVQHAEDFDARFGGTEMFAPIKAVIDRRYKDMPLEVMLLTDGEIWDQQTLFDYLNKEVIEANAPIRVFTLGIGNGVSHSLIEGVAKAGNGFSQSVGEGEKMDSKVVRMLKGALSPHVNDYTLEVRYSNKEPQSNEDGDFEIIEKVADSLKVRLALEEEEKKEPKQPISLFDSSVDLDKEEPPVQDETGETRYLHLPKVAVPKIIQAPQKIPSLFTFNRTTVYLLLGPGSPQKTPKSVVLRATSFHGPLELEIPIQILDTPGQTIHQLAAKKTIVELEQGRGWLPVAKDESDKMIKEKYAGRFDDMVEREVVRLGVQFQVSGKWCSFVAVEKKPAAAQKGQNDYEWIDVNHETKEASPQFQKPNIGGGAHSTYPPKLGLAMAQMGPRTASRSRRVQHSYYHLPPKPITNSFSLNASVADESQGSIAHQDYQMQLSQLEQENKKRLLMARGAQGSSAKEKGGYGGGSLATQAYHPSYDASASVAPSPPSLPKIKMMSGFFGEQQGAPPQPPPPGISPLVAPQSTSALFGSFGSATGSAPVGNNFSSTSEGSPQLPPPAPSSGSLFGSANPCFESNLAGAPGMPAVSNPFGAAISSVPAPNPPRTEDEILDDLIAMQTFEGFWEWTSALFDTIKVTEAKANQLLQNSGLDRNVVATALVVAYFEKKLAGKKGSWELVVEKARGWLGDGAEDVVLKAGVLL